MINFPDAPTTGTQFVAPNGGSWVYDGVKWITGPPSAFYLPLSGGTLTGQLNGTAANFTGSVTALTPGAGDNSTKVPTTAWVDGAITTADLAGRNYIDNALFRVQQRGAGPWTTQQYGPDRWFCQSGSGGSRSVSIGAQSDAGRAQIGDEESEWVLGYQFTGGSGAGDLDGIYHRIEDVKRLSGKTVTVSFWAVASAALAIGFNIQQNFGTGGSPSAFIWVFATGQTFNVTTTWQRFSITFAMPSVAGKTFGTTAWTDFTHMGLYLSSGANNAQVCGIGVQSGTVNFWGVQLEVAPSASPLEKIPVGIDLLRCQRFCQTFNFSLGGYGVAGAITHTSVTYLAVMRAGPAVVISTPSYSNASALVISPGGSVFTPGVTITAAGNFAASATLQFSADL